MTLGSQLTTIKKFKEWREAGKLDAFLPKLQESRGKELMAILDNPPQTIADFNAKINLKSAIIDGRNTGFTAESFDFICSNNTFEHIPKNILVDILKEFKRLLKPDGLMSHFIDMSDHFAHFDTSITDYNFLKFSEKEWSFIDNSIQPQNRLRWADYKKMYADLGIPIKEENTRPGSLNALNSIAVDKGFSHLSNVELAISHGYLVS
jgi:SAM-dependent methyltransferase